MPGKLARRTKNLIRKTSGMIGRIPRILNMDRGPLDMNGTPAGLDIIGYITVNANATTPFSRGKVHKGFFCCQITTDIDDGDLIYDRGDKRYYFMMDGKTQIFNGEEVYVDATMYRCDGQVEIQRFSEDIRDTFGRAVKNTPDIIASNVWAMFNPMNYDIKEQQDRLIADNKIKLCLQSKTGVQVADRIVSEGKMYHITSIDTMSLRNLVLCTVDTDVR